MDCRRGNGEAGDDVARRDVDRHLVSGGHGAGSRTSFLVRGGIAEKGHWVTIRVVSVGLKILGFCVLAMGAFLALLALPILAVGLHDRLTLLSIALIFDLFVLTFSISYMIRIVTGKTRSDGSHLHPALWFVMSLFVFLLPIAGLFTGVYHEHRTAPLHAAAYLLLGMGGMLSGWRRWRTRRRESVAVHEEDDC